MSPKDRVFQRRTAVIGLGVVALSLFAAVEPAAAAAPSRTTLSSSTPSIAADQVGKLKAVVRQTSGTLQPTGTVTFREGTTATSPAVGPPVTLVLVNSVMTAKMDLPGLTPGTHTYIATYSGSTAFNASTSLTTQIVVTAVPKKDSTTDASMSTPAQVVPGEEVKLKAVVKPAIASSVKPTGSVTFSQNGTAILPAVPLELVGTVMTAKLTVTNLSNGSHSIVATYGGSSTFNGSVSPQTITVTVGKAGTTCTLTPGTTNTTTHKTRFAFVLKPVSGTIVPTGGGTWTIDNGAQPSQALALIYTSPATTGRDAISPVFTDGSHTVSVTYDGDATYAACTASSTITTPYTAP